jgi:hypothetical protein
VELHVEQAKRDNSLKLDSAWSLLCFVRSFPLGAGILLAGG